MKVCINGSTCKSEKNQVANFEFDSITSELSFLKISFIRKKRAPR